jgi:flagellar basal body-associated protein FliL
MSEPRPRRMVSGWTVLQVVAVVVWIAGFVIAFYFVSNFTKPSQKAVSNTGQVAGLVLTGVAYLVIIYSMIKHSPDGGS